MRRASPPAWSAPSRPHRAVATQTEELINSKLQFLPETNKSSDSAPDYRIVLGSLEVGAAWQRTAKESGRDYWSVKLDDPAFIAPLYASLVETEDGKTLNLLWSRRSRD